MEAKQHATKQLMSHWRNQRRNLKIPSNENETMIIQNLHGVAKERRSKMEVYSDTSQPQETRKF